METSKREIKEETGLSDLEQLILNTLLQEIKRKIEEFWNQCKLQNPNLWLNY